MPLVFAPFPDVTQRVIQSPRVGVFLSHRMCSSPAVIMLLVFPVRTVISALVFNPAVASVPGDVIQFGTMIVPFDRERPRVERSRSAGPVGILPLGLGRQPKRQVIEVSHGFRQLLVKRLTLFPTDRLHRCLVPGMFEVRRTLPGNRGILCLRYRCRPHPEPIRDSHPVLRPFPIKSSRFILRRSHHELTGRYPPQLEGDTFNLEIGKKPIFIPAKTGDPVRGGHGGKLQLAGIAGNRDAARHSKRAGAPSFKVRPEVPGTPSCLVTKHEGQAG